MSRSPIPQLKSCCWIKYVLFWDLVHIIAFPHICFSHNPYHGTRVINVSSHRVVEVEYFIKPSSLCSLEQRQDFPTLVNRMNISQRHLPSSTKEGTQITRSGWIPPKTSIYLICEAQKENRIHNGSFSLKECKCSASTQAGFHSG